MKIIDMYFFKKNVNSEQNRYIYFPKFVYSISILFWG